MKKIITAAIVLVILTITLFSFLSFDTIETIEAKKREYGGYNIINQMKSGETINLSVSYSVKPLSDDVYHVQVNVSEQKSTDSERYIIRNIRIGLYALGEPIAEYAAYSGTDKSNSPVYGTPRISYNNDNMMVSYETPGSEVTLDMFVTGKFSLSGLELTYDIKGTSIRILNSIIDNTVSLDFEEDTL